MKLNGFDLAQLPKARDGRAGRAHGPQLELLTPCHALQCTSRARSPAFPSPAPLLGSRDGWWCPGPHLGVFVGVHSALHAEGLGAQDLTVPLQGIQLEQAGSRQ